MSSQDNWNNPDMYYPQSQPGPGTGNGYGGSNANYGAASYNSNAAYSNAAYGANPQYAAGMPVPGYGYQPPPPTNTLAIIALVASIFGVVTSIFVGGIAGIVMGHIARKQIKQRGERGDGMATAALWVGYIGTALWILFWIVYVGIFVLIFGATMIGAGSVN